MVEKSRTNRTDQRARAKPSAPPRPVGRPTSYDPAMCERLVGLMQRGHSMTGCAGELGVSRSALVLWEKTHPEFAEAVQRGRAAATLFWERAAMRVAERGGGPGTATIIMFALKNRAPEDWSDKHQIEHSGPGGGAIPVAVNIAITPIPAGHFFNSAGQLVPAEGDEDDAPASAH